MKKNVMLVAMVMFIGCGSGGGSKNSTTSSQYDMWDYIASKNSRTSLLDLYTSNSTHTTTRNRRANVGYIEYTVASTNNKIVDYNGEATVSIVLNGNSLKISGTEVGRYKSIGSTMGACTLTTHHDNITVASTYTFSDVLEFNCGDYKEFYAKDFGNVINHIKTTFTNGQTQTIRYGISVVNNI